MASSNVIEVDVVSRFDSTGTDKAKKATKEYGDGLEKAGEQAGASETRIIGVHDVIDGTATIMQGPGEQGMVSYIQGWADLAGGVEGVLPLLKAMSISTIKAGAAQVATAAKTVAAWTVARATAVASAAQMAAAWLVSLGPIAIVIGVLAALGAAFVLLWKKSETFRDIVRGAVGAVVAPFRAVASAVNAVWDFLGRLVAIAAKVVGAVRSIGAAFGAILNPIRVAVSLLERFIADTFFANDNPPKFYDRRPGGGGGGGHGGSTASPGFAAGGIAGGGWTKVGEHGSEWANLAPGSRIRSNPDSSGYGGMTEIRVVVEVVGGDGKIMQAIRDSVQKSVRQQYGGSVQRYAGVA
jgi:uncharacterized membrane protein YgcG